MSDGKLEVNTQKTNTQSEFCKWCQYCKDTHRYSHTKCKGNNNCQCTCLKREKEWKPYQDYHHVNF